MKKYKNHTLEEYLEVLSRHTPVPGGGSAAALTAAVGAALISMAAHYAKGKQGPKRDQEKFRGILRKSGQIQRRALTLVDLDAQAYAKIIQFRGASPAVRMRAKRGAAKVPREVRRLCYRLIQLTPPLALKGSRFLLSDVKIAVELVYAAFRAASLIAEADT